MASFRHVVGAFHLGEVVALLLEALVASLSLASVAFLPVMAALEAFHPEAVAFLPVMVALEAFLLVMVAFHPGEVALVVASEVALAAAFLLVEAAAFRLVVHLVVVHRLVAFRNSRKVQTLVAVDIQEEHIPVPFLVVVDIPLEDTGLVVGSILVVLVDNHRSHVDLGRRACRSVHHGVIVPLSHARGSCLAPQVRVLCFRFGDHRRPRS